MKAVFVPFSAIEFLSSDEGNDLSFFFVNFEYDHISDEQITAEIPNAKIEELDKDWNIESKPHHARRVAALVKLIESGAKIPPIEMELSEYNRNTNFVTDGHHRIRAFRYLKKKGFHANLGGFETLIRKFRSICRRFQ